MHPPARPLDGDDDGVMHQAVHDGGGDDGISEVVPSWLNVMFEVMTVDPLQYLPSMTLKNREAFLASSCSSRSKPISSMRSMSGEV